MEQLDRIVAWNSKAGLLENEYNDSLESAFQIEEALEGFDIAILSRLLAPRADLMSPKEASRAIIKIAKDNTPTGLTDVERLDKHVDGIVYHIGSLAKLGLSTKQMLEAIDVVMTSNEAKLGCPRDECGKLLKPADFDELYAPEPKLEEILNVR